MKYRPPQKKHYEPSQQKKRKNCIFFLLLLVYPQSQCHLFFFIQASEKNNLQPTSFSALFLIFTSSRLPFCILLSPKNFQDIEELSELLLLKKISKKF